DKIFTFIRHNQMINQKIVLITSGGTTVPLESRTVRYIDNFSIGTRGSTSAEYFLGLGYAVVFLHRRGSLQPYNRNFQHKNFLELFTTNDADDGDVKIKSEFKGLLGMCFAKYHLHVENKTLLNVEFTTLSDYLYLLKVTSEFLNECMESAMLYLAAAVSDFYIPFVDMPQHKIQSSSGPLHLSLQIVPKFLKPLTSKILPRAFVVSFKLETDPSLLLQKCHKALDTYNHQVVIGNILENRKREVVVVTKDSE
ncbi:hypothetical protein HELRODRAFT_142989, partial [Helobdella robusta]|uniref:DNA/pantothenate metabolism flavoprotein C-terminal domain-containing protein n=1 Tax=Helobdella robusta TaxID=6412 RepID=T1EJ84_HELRO